MAGASGAGNAMLDLKNREAQEARERREKEAQRKEQENCNHSWETKTWEVKEYYSSADGYDIVQHSETSCKKCGKLQ